MRGADESNLRILIKGIGVLHACVDVVEQQNLLRNMALANVLQIKTNIVVRDWEEAFA